MMNAEQSRIRLDSTRSKADTLHDNALAAVILVSLTSLFLASASATDKPNTAGAKNAAADGATSKAAAHPQNTPSPSIVTDPNYDDEKNIDELTRKLKSSPGDINALIARGAAYNQTRKWDEAEADLSSAIKKAPKNFAAWFAYGQLKDDSGLTKEAIDAFNHAIQLPVTDPTIFIELAIAQQRIGDTENALANYNKALELGRPEAYMGRGTLRVEAGDTELAIKDFTAAIDSKTTDEGAYYLRGSAYYRLGKFREAIDDYSRLIKSRPDEPYARLARAMARDQLGQWPEALDDYNEAVEIQPNVAYFRAQRGDARLRRHEYDQGIADILKAIELNPDDLGKDYEPITNKKLSPEALRHGEEQARKMLNDRPAMAEHVRPGDELWTYAVRKFAGEDLGSLVGWSPQSPGDFPARSLINVPGRRAAIQVSDRLTHNKTTHPRTFEEIWCSAIFELNNVAASAKFNEIEDRVKRGELTKPEFVGAMLDTEWLAVQRTRAFYLNCYLPWLRKKGLEATNPSTWFCAAFNPDGTAQPDYSAAGFNNHIAYYEAGFDLLSVEREVVEGNTKRAKSMLTALLTKNPGDFEKGLVHYWLGYLLTLDEDFKRADEELTTAIHFDHELTTAIAQRGYARARLERYDDALADFNEAIHLAPDFAYALANRGVELSRRGNYSQSIRDLTAAIEIEPKQPLFYFNRAECWSDLKEFQRAMDDYSAAIKLAPIDERAYRGLADAQKKLLLAKDQMNSTHELNCRRNPAPRCCPTGHGLQARIFHVRRAGQIRRHCRC